MSGRSARGRLGRRLFAATLAFSAVTTLLVMGIRAGSNYVSAERELEEALDEAVASYADPLSRALWTLDKDLVEAQVEALTNLDLIAWASVETLQKPFAEAGARLAGRVRERRASLYYEFRGQTLELGQLTVAGDTHRIREVFIESLARDLPFLASLVVLVSSFLFILADRSIARRIVAAANHFARFDVKVERELPPPRSGRRADEIDALLEEYGRLERRFRESYAGVESARSRAEASEAALQASLREKDVLIGELFHRTRNNLQITLGLLRIEMRETAEPAVLKVLSGLETRIQAMALVHRGLQERKDLARIRLDEYVREFAPFALRGPAGVRPDPSTGPELGLELDAVECSLDVATPFGLALGELLSGLDPAAPCLIRLEGDGEGGFTLGIEGGPGGAERDRLELAGTLIRDQLHGTLETGTGADGRSFVRVAVPYRKLASPH
ncbi:MAG TPA: histidine kinase dimerization/phosphoacceptor domain -containing protein [Spirochaetales bacterium]|nr:histidine kinase dimerization/phosphoacceptor domain -containing protein [Spirochaetales bacterium]